MGAATSRKQVAGQPKTAAKSALVGTFVPGATLGAVTGRGRKADALPAELVAILEQMISQGGVAEASGTAAEVDKLKRQITRWVKERNDNGQPTDKGFRTLSTDAQGRQTGIRYQVFAVTNVEASK